MAGLLGEDVRVTIDRNGTVLFNDIVEVTGAVEVNTGGVSADVTDSGLIVGFSGDTSQRSDFTVTVSDIADESIGAVTSVTQVASSSNFPAVVRPISPRFTLDSITGGIISDGFQPGINASQTLSFTSVAAPVTVITFDNLAGSLPNNDFSSTENGVNYSFDVARPGDFFPFGSPDVILSYFSDFTSDVNSLSLDNVDAELISVILETFGEPITVQGYLNDAQVFSETFNGGAFSPSTGGQTIDEIRITGGGPDGQFYDLNNVVLGNVVTDVTAPQVVSVVRQNPTDASTQADAVTFRVTFDERVKNVDTTDFALSGGLAGTSSVSSVTPINELVYDVLVDVPDAGGGTIGLGFAGGQNIADLANLSLSNTTPTGANETYSILGDNLPPNITTSTNVFVPENQTAVIDVNATDDSDSEGSGLIYSKTGGADQALFNLDTNSGVLTFMSAPDFENPGDAGANNVYDVQVTVTDSGGLTDVEDIAVTVTDEMENTAPNITTSTNVFVPENLTAVVDFDSSDDSDSEGSGLIYSKTGGADQALFDLDAISGVLTFINAPDFENPGDAGANNVYDVQVTVTDSGGLTDVEDIAVTVTDEVENTAPMITSLNTASVRENTVFAIDVNATDDFDSEGSGLTYTKSGGDDAALFSLNASTGELSFTTAPNFENPGDANQNNEYEVQVIVTDSGGLTDTQDLLITVTDEDETSTPIFVADFNDGSDGFGYADDLFRNTAQPDYADGGRVTSGGAGNTPGLRMELGGIDGDDILDPGMSGGFRTSFTLAEPNLLSLSFFYRLDMSGAYEDDEFAEVLVSLTNGATTLFGLGGNDFVERIFGDAGMATPRVVSQDTVTLDLGLQAPGDYTLVLGGHNNKKTTASEDTILTFDNVRLDAVDTSALPPILEADFASGLEGFAYVDDAFRATNEPDYADGGRVANGGVGNTAALQMELGGIDGDDIGNPGMSGGFETTFTLSEATQLDLSFFFRLDVSGAYEDDEFSEVLVSLTNGTTELFGRDGNDFVERLTGDAGKATPRVVSQDTVSLDLGLQQAGTYTLTLGGRNNKKTTASEDTILTFDNVVLEAGDIPSRPEVINADFSSGSEGFAYRDDAFRGTNEPGFADGGRETNGGVSNSPALVMELGGINDDDIGDPGMSGGFDTSFTLDQATHLTLSFFFELDMSGSYEDDEFAEVLVSLTNGGTTLFGQNGDDFVDRLTGDAGMATPRVVSQDRVTLDLGLQEAGDYTLTLGGRNNKKTTTSENTIITFDDVLLEAGSPSNSLTSLSSALGSFDALEDKTESIGTETDIFIA